jgi:hypothetical protein
MNPHDFSILLWNTPLQNHKKLRMVLIYKEVKNGGFISPLPHMSLWHSVKWLMHRDNFNLALSVSANGISSWSLHLKIAPLIIDKF